MDKFTGLVGFSDAPEHQSPDELTQENPMTLINHFYVGVNPDDLDGAWDTGGEALINFAKQFQEVAKQAEGNFLFVRRAPVLSGRAWFESGRVRWRMMGRFSIATLKKRQPLTDEQIKVIHFDLCNTVGSDYKTVARAIEAAHNIGAKP